MSLTEGELRRREKIQEARELILEAHDSGMSNIEIQSITGLAMKTIKRWIARPQSFVKDETVAKILLLDYDQPNRYHSHFKCDDPGAVDRVYNSLEALIERGLAPHDIARISEQHLSWVRRFLRVPREDRAYVTEQAVRGAERIEKYLESVNSRQARDERRAAHRRYREAHVGGA